MTIAIEQVDDILVVTSAGPITDESDAHLHRGALGYPPTMQIANVDREKHRPHNDSFRLMARDRGLDVQHFHALEDAFDWFRDRA